jgi:peroxiredoxin
LKIGQAAPDFTLPDAFGKQVSLNELLARGPVVISFYRGEWCP